MKIQDFIRVSERSVCEGGDEWACGTCMRRLKGCSAVGLHILCGGVFFVSNYLLSDAFAVPHRLICSSIFRVNLRHIY